jgi:rare lipoprotein A
MPAYKETLPMKRVVIAAIAIATLIAFTTSPTAFATTAELSSAGTETGIAACYSRRLTSTSSGKRYNPNALSAPHATIRNGTNVKVANLDNGQSVVVRVNDRLPAHAGGGIIIDISHRACKELKFGRGGEAKVKLEVLNSNAAANASH